MRAVRFDISIPQFLLARFAGGTGDWAVHAVLRAPPAPASEVLVIGSGPIAFATIWALRAIGFEGTVVAQAKRPAERALAEALGATEVVAPGEEAVRALEHTGARSYAPKLYAGGGFDPIFDCVGNESSVAQALAFARPRGRVVLLGCAAELRRVDLAPLWSRELEVVGAVGYGFMCQHSYLQTESPKNPGHLSYSRPSEAFSSRPESHGESELNRPGARFAPRLQLPQLLADGTLVAFLVKFLVEHPPDGLQFLLTLRGQYGLLAGPILHIDPDPSLLHRPDRG